MKKEEFEIKYPKEKLEAFLSKVFELLRKNKKLNIYPIGYRISDVYSSNGDLLSECRIDVSYSLDGKEATTTFYDYYLYSARLMYVLEFGVIKVNKMEDKALLRFASKIWMQHRNNK